MNNLQTVLDNRFEQLKLVKVKEKKEPKKQRPLNMKWERAKIFGEKLGLPVPFILKLIKIHGIGKVRSAYTYVADSPAVGRIGNDGKPITAQQMLLWYLKNKI